MKAISNTPETTVEFVDGVIRITQPADGQFYDHDPVIEFDHRLAECLIEAIRACADQAYAATSPRRGKE